MASRPCVGFRSGTLGSGIQTMSSSKHSIHRFKSPRFHASTARLASSTFWSELLTNLLQNRLIHPSPVGVTAVIVGENQEAYPPIRGQVVREWHRGSRPWGSGRRHSQLKL